MKIDIKMHTGIMFTDDVSAEQKSFIFDKLNSLNQATIDCVNITNIKKESLIGEFLFLDNSLSHAEQAKDILKKEEYNFKIFTNQDAKNFSRKLPYHSNMAFINSSFDLEVKDYTDWKKCLLNIDDDVVFIGDIHEHPEPLELLIKKIPKEARIVMLGDYLDKGGATEKTVNLIESLVNDGAKLITANHESYVAKRLLGKIDAIPNEEEIFSSLPFLFKNQNVADKVLKLYEKSLPFLKVNMEETTVYATHAPCKKKYLGKLSSNAMRSQRNYYFPERGVDGMRKELEFTLNENIDFFHVFGHVAHNMSNLEVNNRIWLDTGSVYGNMLSSVLFRKDGSREFIQIPTEGLTKDDLFSFEFKKSVRNKL